MRDPKGKLWTKVKREIIKDFSRRGIIKCEMCHCLPSMDFDRQVLDLAHSKKRRKITCEEELREVALLCRKCHMFVEYNMTHEEMEQTIKDIIRRRDGIETIFD